MAKRADPKRAEKCRHCGTVFLIQQYTVTFNDGTTAEVKPYWCRYCDGDPDLRGRGR